ncbi:MAG: UV DNA damage repair endonuclease UvsE [Candidatus Hodarchaeota archaeon]
MKLGYVTINRSIGCTANSNFRLASYSEEKLKNTVHSNLDCLLKILKFNIKHDIFFFRISSNTVPFASHPICKFNWADYFKSQFKEIGEFIKENDIRISMHPDQFIVINSLRKAVVDKSIKDLIYHSNVLDTMGLDNTAKIQIHVGGVYNNKKEAVDRFCEIYKSLNQSIKNRLVIENDEKSYSLKDCLEINENLGIPVVFDTLHHEYNNNQESQREAILKAKETWEDEDGLLMIDYSTQEVGEKKGKHTTSIDLTAFKKFLQDLKGVNFDIMLEIKDKEKSALKAVKLIKELAYI